MLKNNYKSVGFYNVIKQLMNYYILKHIYLYLLLNLNNNILPLYVQNPSEDQKKQLVHKIFSSRDEVMKIQIFTVVLQSKSNCI